MKRTISTILAFAIVFVLVAIGGYQAYYYGHYLPEQRRMAQMEHERLLRQQEEQKKSATERQLPLDTIVRRGLAHPDMVLMGYFNDLSIGKISKGISLPDIQVLPTGDLLRMREVLARAGRSAATVRQTYFALYPHFAGISLTPITVFLGRFNAGAIRETLLRDNNVENKTVGRVQFSVLHELDKDSCERKAAMAIYVSNDLFIAGDPGLLPRVVNRLSQPETAEYIDPAKWHHYSEEKMLSFWLRYPQANVRRFFPKPYDSFVKESNLAFRTFENGFVSYDTRHPDGDVLSLELHGRNVNRVLEVHKQWKKVLREHNEALTLQVRVLDNAISKLSMETEARTLKMSLSMERAWYRNWADITQSVTRYVKDKIEQPVVQRSKKQSSTLLADRLATNPPAFLRSAPTIDLRPYNAGLLSDKIPDQTAGPFGILLDNIQDRGEGTSFTLSVIGTHIPNLGDGIGKATLNLSPVLGNNGQPLQNQSFCGPKRFISSIDLRRHEELDLHQADVTVYLEPGVQAKEVASIEGSISIALPEKTSTHPIFLPTRLPYTESVRGLKVSVFSLNNGVIEYGFEGDTDRVLAFRALDAKRQVLYRKHSRRSKTDENSLFPQGVRFTDIYEGRIHSLELVYADAIEHIDYPFAINGLVVNSNQAHIVVPEPDILRISPEHFREEVKQFVERNKVPLVGPFYTELSQLKNWKSLTGDVRIIAPASVPGLLENLTTRFTLDTAELLDGTKVDLADSHTIEGLVSVTDESKILAGRLLFLPMRNKPDLLQADFTMKSDIQVNPRRVKSLHGEFEIHLPQSANKLSIPAVNVGDTVGGEGFSARLVQVSQAGYELRVDKGAERLIRVVPRDISGASLAPYVTQVIEVDGALQVKLEAGRAQTLDIYIANDTETLKFPVTLLYEGQEH